MLTQKAAAWALVLSTFCLPATSIRAHKSLAYGALPQTPMAESPRTEAETVVTPAEILQADIGEPPSTLQTIKKGKSRDTEESDRQTAQKEIKRLAEAKKTALKKVSRIEYPSKKETARISQSEQKEGEYVRIIGKSNEQCVIFFKRMAGIARGLGYAGSIPSQGDQPKIGAGALERSAGHVSLVIAIEGQYLIVNDSNWIKGSITQRKVLQSSMRGYIYQ